MDVTPLEKLGFKKLSINSKEDLFTKVSKDNSRVMRIIVDKIDVKFKFDCSISIDNQFLSFQVLKSIYDTMSMYQKNKDQQMIENKKFVEQNLRELENRMDLLSAYLKDKDRTNCPQYFFISMELKSLIRYASWVKTRLITWDADYSMEGSENV